MKYLRLLLVISYLFFTCGLTVCQAAAEPVVTITGLVKHPQRLTLKDLANYRTVEVRTTEVATQNTFHGVYRYQGVPLQYLLQAAGVEKEGGTFPKAIDLALVVRNRQGQRTLLSWAEVAYGRPADVIIAFSATPIYTKETPTLVPKPLVLPRLVLGNDFYSDRCLTDIVSIEVIDPTRDAAIQPVSLAKRPNQSISEVTTKIVWNGTRFDGVKRFSGTPLVDILKQAGVGAEPQTVFLVRSRDGYRSLLSYGELFWSPLGRRILLADRMGGQPLGEKHARWLVLPDSSASRFVRDVASIEVLRPRHVPKLTVIGVGAGDTCQITLEALSALARADAIAVPGDIQKRFATYLSGKEVLFDPFAFADRDRKTPLSETERDRLRQEEWRTNAGKIRKALDAGKNVAFLDWGDPMIYGSSRWIREYLDEAEIETVAGLSSLNAANAVINRDISANGSTVITAPRGLRRNDELLAAVAKNGDTLAIFMGLQDVPELESLLRTHFADNTPVRLVYAAGIRSREHQISITLGEMRKAAQDQKEKMLGLIYIGSCLAEGNAACN
ncbi:MAG: SAM-dependent methyltransferase [Pedobacter sp.]